MAQQQQSVSDAAKAWREAQHVQQVVGGRAAAQQTETARQALVKAAGVRR
jgi:hypothetical protein